MVLAALVALLAAVLTRQEISERPREALGKDSGGHFGPFLCGHAEEAGKSSKVFMLY